QPPRQGPPARRARRDAPHPRERRRRPARRHGHHARVKTDRKPGDNRPRTDLTLEDRRAPPYHQDKKAWQELAASLEADRGRVRQGGGARAAERQHRKGRLTARERVALLTDEGAPFDELMSFAGWEMYPEE